MGHSQYPHGLHSTGFLTIGWRALSKADQRPGSAGPKIVRLGVSTAFAIWDGPVSLLMKRSNLLMSAANPPMEVLPARFSGCAFIPPATSCTVELSSRLPVKIICAL